MPEKQTPRGEKKDIRSMRDAVSDLRSFASNPSAGEKPKEAEKRSSAERGASKDARKSASDGKLHSMRDAVEEMRVYGAGKTHRAEHAEKTPGEHGSTHSKKKKRSLIDRLLHPEKKIRRSAKRELTFFGHRITFWPLFIGFFLLLMALVFLLNSTNLTVDEQKVTLMGLPSDLEGYRILVLSDLNGKRFGEKQATLLRQLDALSYDAVFCLGDMVGEGGDPEPFYELLDGLPSSKKVYFVCGDSDPGPYAASVREESAVLSDLVLHDWILGAQARGAIYVDSTICLNVGDTKLYVTPTELLNLDSSESAALWKEQTLQEESGYLAGVVADKGSLPFTSYRYQIAQNQLAMYGAMGENDIHLAIGHVPPSDEFLTAACGHSPAEGKYLTAPDLVLAGHYCGGVWNLPLLGAFYIPDSSADRYGWFPQQDRVSGLREVDELQMYVTRGLSNCGDTPLMPFRLLNSPEITIITLTATLPVNMLD